MIFLFKVRNTENVTNVSFCWPVQSIFGKILYSGNDSTSLNGDTMTGKKSKLVTEEPMTGKYWTFIHHSY